MEEGTGAVPSSLALFPGEEGAKSSSSSSLHPDLFKAATKLLCTVRTTGNHRGPWSTMAGSVQALPFAWELHPPSSSEVLGPDHDGKERGSGTVSASEAVIASHFELRVTYGRAGGKQRRDCMCLLFPGALSVSLPCPALLMASTPAMALLHSLASHS